MKGIILAGGTGSRLMPLTKITNKHLLPVGKEPMIIHGVNKLVESGINDIMIVTGTEHMGDMVTLLGSGKDLNCQITYKVQDEPDGIAGALRLCENFVGQDSVAVLLGDNIFQDSLATILSSFHKLQSDQKGPVCSFAIKEVEDPQRFGVAEISDGKILSIEEKPKQPKSNYCITGIYVYDATIFEFIKTLRKSNRGEYEITDINNEYVKLNGATYTILDGWWTDAGTHESYHKANLLIRGINE